MVYFLIQFLIGWGRTYIILQPQNPQHVDPVPRICKFNEEFADRHLRYSSYKARIFLICHREGIFMKRFILFACCLIGLTASAQDLTGIWRGNFNQNNGRPMGLLDQTARYKFEVQLAQDGKLFDGVTYSYLTTVFYGKAVCKGTVNPLTKKVFLEELKIVELRMTGGSSACVMTLFLQYSKMGDEEFLEGTYTGMNERDSTACGRGTVFLRKVTTSDFYKEPMVVQKELEKEKKKEIARTDSVQKKGPATKPPTQKVIAKTNSTPSVKKPVVQQKITQNTTTKPSNTKPSNQNPVTQSPTGSIVSGPEKKMIDTPKKVVIKPANPVITPKVLVSRENELVKTIVTKSKEIVINIYDNGSIDNDTVSVYLDKKLVLSKKRLTDKALTLKIQLDDDQDYHELVMVAENLGEVPPNTSLMIVHAGEKQYEVRITSTEQKNAVVIFRYDKNR